MGAPPRSLGFLSHILNHYKYIKCFGFYISEQPLISHSVKEVTFIHKKAGKSRYSDFCEFPVSGVIGFRVNLMVPG